MKTIPIDAIQGGEILAKDIYMENGAILMTEGTVLRVAYKERLRSMGCTMVMISEEESAHSADRVTEKKIQKHCQESVRAVIDKYSYGVDAELNEIAKAAEEIMTEVLSEPKVLYNVSRVRDKNNSIYLHCINVSALSVLIGMKMRLPERRLKNLAVGALLHDIGLIYLPTELQDVNMDACGEEVRKEVKRHVIYGYTSVEKEDWLSAAAKDIIINHHERIDGSGFPFRLTGDKLPLETKIVSLCDEFDSMVYGFCMNKCKIMEAMNYITGLADIKFDFRVVQTFLASVAAYPIGTAVKLNTGALGLVVRQNESLPTRPVIRLVKETQDGMTATDEFVDLTQDLTTIIVDTVEM